MVDNLVDVLMITETWLSRCGDEVIIGEVCPAGYRFFNQPRLGRNGGGVGLLCKASLDVKTSTTIGVSSTWTPQLLTRELSG